MLRALSVEYESKGIIIQSLCPFVVVTKMAAGLNKSLTQPTPEEYVNSSIKTIGYQTVSHGCLTHNLLVKIKKLNAIFKILIILILFFKLKGWFFFEFLWCLTTDFQNHSGISWPLKL